MTNVSKIKDLSKEELSQLIKFGFTKKGFYKFKSAYLKAKGTVCQ